MFTFVSIFLCTTHHRRSRVTNLTARATLSMRKMFISGQIMNNVKHVRPTLLNFFTVALTMIALGACSSGNSPDAIYEHAAIGAYDAAITYDGTRAVISTVNHGIIVWNIQQNKQLYRWQQDKETNQAIFTKISFDDKYALTASEKDFAIWSLENGKSLGFYSISDSVTRDIALSNEGRYVLIGREDGKAEHVDLKTGRRILFLGHTDKINTVSLSPNGRFALTGGNDYTAYLWDTRTGQVIYRFNHGRRVILVMLDAKGKLAFTTDSAKRSIIWDLETGQEHSKLQYIHRHESFSTARFVNDEKWLITGSPTRALKVWDTQSGELLMKRSVATRKDLRPRSSVVYAVSLYNNQTIVTESSAGYAELWSVKDILK